MKGSVVKKGRRWYVIIEDVDRATGERRRRWHSGYDTKKEADAERIRLLSEQQRGAYTAPSRLTVANFLDGEWLPAVRSSIRPSTFSSYTATVKLHVVPRIGDLRLQRLTAGHLNGLYADLLVSGRANGSGGLSPTSVAYVHRVIRKSLNDAVQWGYLVRNPATRTNPPSAADVGRMRTWTAAQISHFLQSVQRDRLFAAWRLACTTGMRRGEILGLTWDNVNLDTGTLVVRQSLVSVNYQVHLSEPKTGRGRRSVAIDAGTALALRDHRKQQIADQLANPSMYRNPDNFVFTREDGSPIHPDRFTKMFNQRVRSAGLPRIRLHDVRHSVATLALESGAHPKVVSDRLGHFSSAFTMDVYSHVGPNL